eukprot:384752_1
MELERYHVENNFNEEIKELEDLFPKIGITNKNSVHLQMQRKMTEFYRENPEALLQFMQVLEFGIIEDETRSPLTAGFTSCGLFVIGSLTSIISFIFPEKAMDGLIAATLTTTLALLIVGAVKTWATR